MRTFKPLVTGIISVILAILVQTAEPQDFGPILVADQYFWAGPEGNLAVRITGKFHSETALQETLRLDNEIGRFPAMVWPNAERTWTLGNILLSLDLNGNGYVATWIVSGPKPLIANYVEYLESRYADRSLFYGFSQRTIQITTSHTESTPVSDRQSVPITIEVTQDVPVKNSERHPDGSVYQDRGSLYSSTAFRIDKGQRFQMIAVLGEGGCRIEYQGAQHSLGSCPWLPGFTDHQADIFRIVFAGPVGHYRSVSESEWSIDLYLESDGSALVVHQAWLPGREDLTTDEYSGSWSISGAYITLGYDGNVDTLQYSETRSFRHFGCPGFGKGVETVGDVSGFELSLWTVESLSAIPDPCTLQGE